MTSPSLISYKEFGAALSAQCVTREHLAFQCPKCGTIQSARDLIRAGAGADVDGVMDFLGTSCVGRFTGAGSPRKVPDGQACNWTLDGLLQIQDFGVIENGVTHAVFAPATPEEAQSHMRQALVLDAGLPKAPYGFDDFFRDAARLNLTIGDLVPMLAARPEFADCVPGTPEYRAAEEEEAQRRLIRNPEAVDA